MITRYCPLYHVDIMNDIAKAEHALMLAETVLQNLRFKGGNEDRRIKIQKRVDKLTGSLALVQMELERILKL